MKVKHQGTMRGDEKEFLDLFQKLCYSRSSWQVWSDLMCVMACAISNAVDISPTHREPREKEYEQCIKRLGSVEIASQMLAIVVMALEKNPEQDFLGEMYMRLNLGNHWKGQFFTPYCVCKAMSEITVGDASDQIDSKGYVSICDPACGAGATLIAAANTFADKRKDYQNHVLFVGAGHRQSNWHDVLHPVVTTWMCRVCVHRKYSDEPINRARPVSCGTAGAGVVVYTDFSLTGMDIQKIIQFINLWKWNCNHSKNSGKRAVYIFFRF